MRHIHQLGTSDESYTYILTDIEDLENHPSMIQFPNLFEIVEGEAPEGAQVLNFSYEEPE